MAAATTVVAAFVFASIATVALPLLASAAVYNTTPISGLSNPWGIAFDAAGDLFVANSGVNTVTVLPQSSGVIFGQFVTAGVAVTLSAASGLDSPAALTFDAAGNLFIGNNNNNTITVLPKSSGVIFGQSVIANTAVTLTAATSFSGVFGLAFDSSGDLFGASEGSSSIVVIPASSGTIFGRPVTADSETTLLSYPNAFGPASVAFDASGDMFVANLAGNTITVDPASSGTIFGQSVTADVPTTLNAATGLQAPWSMAFDKAGDLFVANDAGSGEATVIPASSGTLFGQAVTANTAATFLSGQDGVYYSYGLVFDSSGDLYSANQGNNTVTELMADTPQTVTFTSNDSSPSYGSTYTPTVSISPMVAGTLAPVFSIGSSSGPGVCSVSSAGVVTMTKVGTCVLDATVAASGSLAAGSTSQTFSVIPASVLVTASSASMPYGGIVPVITPGISGLQFGENPNKLGVITCSTSATSSSTVATYPSSCSGGSDPNYTVSYVQGQVSVDAIAPGAPTGVSATAGNASITATWAAPTFTGGAPISGYTLAATPQGGGSAMSQTFSSSATTETLIGLSNSAPYDLTVAAENTGYAASGPSTAAANNPITPSLLTQAITLTSTPPINPPLSSSYVVSATGGNSGIPVVLSVDSATTGSACSITADVVYFNHPGICVIDATEAAGSGYAAAPQMQQTISVAQVTPTITWPMLTTVTYDTVLSSDQLNATASIPGTFTYAPPLGTLEGAGADTITATFTPTDSTDYASATMTATLHVAKAVPVITWSTPNRITSGSALSSAELDATASVPGAFTYSPSAGTVPNPGATTLEATFTPTDLANYTSATQAVSLVVDSSTTTTSTTSTTVPPTSATVTTTSSTSTTTTTVSPISTTLPTTPTTSPPTSVPPTPGETTADLAAAPSGTVDIEFSMQPGISITAGKVHIHGHDFVPGSVVTIVAHSTPTLLGTARVEKDGTFSGAFALPAGLPVGAHHIIVSGTLQGGTVVAQEEGFTVASGGVLGTVGSPPPGPLANDVAFVPSAHRATVLATAAGGAVAIGAVASSLGGGFTASGSGGSGGGTGGGGGGGGYLEDVELEREAGEFEGGSRGDRSRTWRWPWTRRLDRFSAHYPSRIAAISPVAGRVLVDGDYLRAMFGSAWLFMCLGALGLGTYAASSTRWYAVPPTLPLFLAVLGLSIFDSTLGYLAGLTFFTEALVAGHVTSALELRTGAGIVLVWFAVPLAAAALRPLRRNLAFNLAGLWDRAADVVIGGLFAAWAAEKMTGALSGLAGVELPIAKDVDTIAFAVLGFVGLRIVLETIATHHYPKRLEQVQHRGGLESENLQVGLSLIVQIILFLFISIAFMGSTWGLYVGAAVFFSPLVPWLFADKIPKSRFVTRWKPTGLVNWTLIIVTGVLLSRLLDHLVHNNKLVEVLGFILLPLPVLISWGLELFEAEEEEEDIEAEDNESAERAPLDPSGELDDDHGIGLPVLAYAGAAYDPEMSRSPLAELFAPHAEEGFLEAESARSKFRVEQEERYEVRAEHLKAGATWKAWLTRLAGVPLVVISVYLVVAHIAGG